ncbi:hypothetical protein HK104_000166 [Borealophlyctis nickersoniae]|nr:hypothetical protein HK104_000166 [Borealophlyctis nickersoniae]
MDPPNATRYFADHVHKAVKAVMPTVPAAIIPPGGVASWRKVPMNLEQAEDYFWDIVGAMETIRSPADNSVRVILVVDEVNRLTAKHLQSEPWSAVNFTGSEYG